MYYENLYRPDIWANQDTAEFAKELLQGTRLSSTIWEINHRNGVDLVMKDGQWHGYTSKNGNIELGTQEVPNTAKTFFGFDKGVPDKLVKQYMLSHENMHHILFDIKDRAETYPGFQNLLNVARSARWHKNVGLSKLGGHPLYGSNQRDTAHEEDIVELLNRYCINPNILKAHLQFLVDANQETLDKQGLLKINQQAADLLFMKVAEIVEQFLANNETKI